MLKINILKIKRYKKKHFEITDTELVRHINAGKNNILFAVMLTEI
jgi:hypothetical protein